MMFIVPPSSNKTNTRLDHRLFSLHNTEPLSKLQHLNKIPKGTTPKPQAFKSGIET